MRDRSRVVLAEAYEVRLAARDVLLGAAGTRGGDPSALRKAATALDEAAARASDPEVATTYSAFADAVRIAALLVEWRASVLDADANAERFRRGAGERADLWRDEQGARDENASFAGLIASVKDMSGIADVGALCRALASAPLAISVLGHDPPSETDRWTSRFRPAQQETSQEDLAVAFLAFTVDGEPASDVQFLTPMETHDLEIEVRVSRWPDEAQELRLTPLSVEAPGAFELPDFRLSRPSGKPPFQIRQRGRALIKVPQALRARPFEFRYAAEFLPRTSEQPVAIVGHRTLRIESIDVRLSPLTGYPGMDLHLLEIRDRLRRSPGVSSADLDTAISLLVPLASLAARAVQDDLFPKPIPEAEFQILIRDELRRRADIGSELEEHAHAGGGETDLSLRGIRLELKVPRAGRLDLASCQPFIEQTAAYAVGSGRRLGLLCVLDASPRSEAALPAETGVGISEASNGACIVTVLIQGGLPRPSDLSRRPRSKST